MFGGRGGFAAGALATHATMKRCLYAFGLAAALGLGAGCATQPTQTAQSGPTATCPVCHYNHDLACVNVRVNDTTPRQEHDGVTYFFCSEECRAAFAKRPARYLPKP